MGVSDYLVLRVLGEYSVFFTYTRHQAGGPSVLFNAIILTTLVLISLHIIEIILWAVLYVFCNIGQD